jgi:hypothetical protein
MPRPARAIAALLPVLVLTAFTASAGAAFAPKLTAKIDPATPDVKTAITTTVTQGASETASKKVEVTFPKGFALAADALDKPTCNAQQEAAKACPANTRLGDATAVTTLGTFKGGVFNTGIQSGGQRLVVFLSNGVSLLDQKVVGIVVPKPTGFVTTFDNLPDIVVTSFKLALEGAPTSLLKTPETCGDFAFKAKFTSHKGETATDTATVTVSGCPPPKPAKPRITNVKLKKKIKQGRTATLSCRFSVRPTKGTVSLYRGKKRLARASFTAPGFRFKVTKVGQNLPRGSYKLVLRIKGKGGTAKKTVRFRVVR